ncbi:non-structural maintenance of chromosomes element 1 homolog [Linepithema humile]|uniref:non-structural maintenance of chromosomes element 1 homolog n=1 Tax=Linepithema humile TaxID=83485 RepID=UPI0006238425|nr:PREDICTED: non-structural maintenance of chromosomes element 1 homolog [Linepithema humile]
MVYNNKHKIILQTIINEGALSEKCGKKLVKQLFDHDRTGLILNEINKKLQPLYMTIKCTNCEVTGELYWVFASTLQDKTASYHPEFSQAQLTLLRNIYSEIVTSNNGYASSTWCLNLCSSLHIQLTKADAEEFLSEIVKKKWLFCKNGKYFMGVRSIAELLQYFKDTYDDNLHTCALCKQALFHGEKCEECNTAMHIHCLKTCVTNQDDLQCPNCQNPISSNNDSNTVTDLDDTYMETSDTEMRGSSQRRATKRKLKD